MSVLGKGKKTFEHVNLEQVLEKDGLSELFPPEIWPELNAVRDFATEIKSLKKGESIVLMMQVCLLRANVVHR